MDKMAETVLPRLKNVVATRSSLVLKVVWADGTSSRVDLTGLVHSSRHFGVFADDREAFGRVKVDEFGTGVEWANGLDYSAATLAQMAAEQQPVTGKHLRTFLARYKLNPSEMAALLDVSVKTIRNYEKAAALPRTVGIALRRFEKDPTTFAALYRPVTLRPRGRPRQTSD
jgi:hypothetical protein